MASEFEEIRFMDEMLAIIIYSEYENPGTHFFTSSDLSQQVAYMQHKMGKDIDAHVHKDISRNVTKTQEVLIIKDGKLRVDFYNRNKEYLESRLLKKGDIILLVSGGHGFHVVEDLKMVEVKQGPYSGDEDKERFPGVSPEKVILKHHDFADE